MITPQQNTSSLRRGFTGYLLATINVCIFLVVLFLMRHIWGEINAFVQKVTWIFIPWIHIFFFLFLIIFLYLLYVLYKYIKLDRYTRSSSLPSIFHHILAVIIIIIMNGMMSGLLVNTGCDLRISGKHVIVKKLDRSFQQRGFNCAAISESLGNNIARFYGDAVDPEKLPPSLAFEKPVTVIGPLPEDWKVIPEFKYSKNNYSVLVSIDEGTSLYGTGETAGSLLRNGKITQAYNTDAYAYDDDSIQLYQSHPWVLAVRGDGSSFGILADTTYRCLIDCDGKIRFKTRGHPFPVIIIEGKGPQQVLKKLASLTGTMPLPTRWSLGYHQCRYSYYPDKQVRDIASTFREKNIPCDVIWLDIHYMNDYRVFTFHPERFPDPSGLNDYLHGINFKSVWIIDPGIKAEEGYFMYDEGSAGNHWVKTADGSEYHGLWHAGMCAFPDFTRPSTRKWWASKYKAFLEKGMDGIWNDMNEPAISGVPDKTMPDDNRHAGGGMLPPGPHVQYHNVYGMLMVKATRQGMKDARPNRRPFVLSRANYIGGHRYAATWTGDNVSNWEHLYFSVPMILNLGLSGQPFSGPDIGGFAENATGELFARWMGVGAFFPFCRGHTSSRTIPHEPWAFGKEVEDSCRTALQRRYRLLPYIYTLFHESSKTGLPVMRPVFFANPENTELRDEDHAFLLGTDLLVIPRLSEDGDHNYHLPDGIWREFTLVGEDPSVDPDQPVMKIRGGSIIPLGRVVQSTEENSFSPLTLLVCPDDKGTASGTLYEDEGDGYAYMNGRFRKTVYTASTENGITTVRIGSRSGSMILPDRKVQVIVITKDGPRTAIGKIRGGIQVTL
ncbi:MAG: TIM-barrel domain-containing protein [Spirochaetota bacterium]